MSSLEDFNKGDNKNIQLAAACFVTDTTNCSGNEFANADSDDNDGGVPPGGDDYDLDNAERCRQEGYNQTSCPEGQEPVNTCPYDSNYFEKCVSSCPSNYVTCEVPYYGVGEDCDGKYASCEKDTERACKEENPNYTNSCDYGFKLSDDRCSYDSSYGTCCNACTGYPYTPNGIPDGYIQDGEPCFSCDGLTLVKAKPNPCDGFMDCGSMGPEIGAKSCQSGNQIKYDNCKACPNLGTLTYCPAPFTCSYEDCSGLYYKTGCQPGYDWNESTKTCTKQCAYECTLTSCPSPFTCRYEDCSGKYCKTGCQSGYDWNSGSQTCTKQCAYECTYTNCPSPFTCRYEDCSGKYCKTGCQSGYDWNSSTKTCTKQCTPLPNVDSSTCGSYGTKTEDNGCGGTHTVCNCPTYYEYNENNCPLSDNFHCAAPCGGLYRDCEAKISSTYTISSNEYTRDDIGTYAISASQCPKIKDFISSYSAAKNIMGNKITTISDDRTTSGTSAHLCIDADQNCYDLFKKLQQNSKQELNVNQDMYCGNLFFDGYSKTDTIINGNGHTLTFKSPNGLIFKSITLKNINIELTTIDNGEYYDFTECVDKASSTDRKFQNVNIEDTNITLYGKPNHQFAESVESYGSCQIDYSNIGDSTKICQGSNCYVPVSIHNYGDLTFIHNTSEYTIKTDTPNEEGVTIIVN